MATVKLTAPRSRGESEFYAGDLYECADGEASELIAGGYAVAVKSKPEPEPEPQKETAALEPATEKAVERKPRPKKEKS